MSKLYGFLAALFCFLLILPNAQATHNRAGEIWVQRDTNDEFGLTVIATIVTYTKASSRPADRDTLTICWDNGSVCERVARSNGLGSPPQGEELQENDTKRNLYIATHRYPARGTFIISMTDPNRNGEILNVNPPFSDQIPFHIQTTYTITSPNNQGYNDAPILLQPPVDIGCVGKVFTHNPNAFDADGDSMSYHFIVPMEDINVQVPNYSFPDEIGIGLGVNNITIDPVNGNIVWDSPRVAGEYNLAMIIVSYRNGVPLDTVVRDMQILIEECNNEPPVVEVPFEEVCVVAGELLTFEVTATAPLTEVNQQVRLTALGGPFEVSSPATFLPPSNAFEEDPVVRTFSWQTTCEQISAQFYTVVFKATDNFFGDTLGLSDLKTVRIKVVGPPPQDVQAEAGGGRITVSWEQPYFCEDADNDYFRGFTVWRRIGASSFPIDTCSPGLDGSGYSQLNFSPRKDMQDGRYFYEDTDVERGQTYCYRVLGVFAQSTPLGQNTYNQVESLASDSVCIQLNRDIPLMTNVDVLNTSTTNGEIEVCWSKPVAEDLDTLQNPGPYLYEVLRAPGLSPPDADFQPIGVEFGSPTFAGANDTCFVDTGLNTQDGPYSYRVNFYVRGDELLGTAKSASSVFLSTAPTDNTSILSWEEDVPWENFAYVVLRENATGGFDSIATVTEQTYRDMDLINGTEYCYRIRAVGSYGIEGIAFPLINRSQRACEVPFDNVPPCPPTLEVSNACDQEVDCTDEEALSNLLRWANPMDICEETDDVVTYRVYYAPFEGSEFSFIAEIEDAQITEFDHQPDIGIAGCYAVTALDTFLNESERSNIICVDNCPFYELPNTFTPNGDNQNDLYRPYPYCFIERVDFKVYNRWGQVVFATADPDLNWDGRNERGEELPEGTYYYACSYFERRVDGILPGPEILKGYIELIRGNR